MSSHAQQFPPRAEVLSRIAAPIPKIAWTASIVLAVVGILIFVVGLFVDPTRAWRALHFNWLYFTIISSAAVAFSAVQRLTTARWSRPIMRFAEGYVAFLPVAFVILLAILAFGSGHIFTWTHEDPAAGAKATYLNPAFFYPRVIVSYAVICVLSVWYVWSAVRLDVGITRDADLPFASGGWGRSLRDRMRRGFGDERRELHSTHSMQGKLAIAVCMAFGIFWVVLAWDLSMTLSLHFQSTMYGWQVFMGAWVVMLMTWAMLTMWWQKHLNVHDIVNDAHFHDLGKLCFAFTAFWGYLTFSQYLVIWYGNWYEETHYFRLRLMPPWTNWTVSVFVLMFIVPFFGLMAKSAKLFKPTFIIFALSSTLGLWLHRFLEVYPSTYGEISAVPFGLWEIGAALGMLGLWGICYIWFMDSFPRMRVLLMTSPYRDEVQIPVDARTMEPLPAHE